MSSEIRFNDSPTGARKLLEEESDYFSPQDIQTASYVPDPEVPGCWLVRLRNGMRILAYVGSHPLAPDFEVVEG